MNTVLQCRCGRLPRLVETECLPGRAYNGSHLRIYVLRCRPYWGLFGTHVTTKPKGVALIDAWHKWREDLIEEWNAAVTKENQ